MVENIFVNFDYNVYIKLLFYEKFLVDFLDYKLLMDSFFGILKLLLVVELV